MNRDLVLTLIELIENICERPVSKPDTMVGFDHTTWSDRRKLDRALENFEEIHQYIKEIKSEVLK